MKLIKRICWRLQFKKVKLTYIDHWMQGRCTKCDAGNPKVECSELNGYHCPCKFDEYLKRVRTFNWLYK